MAETEKIDRKKLKILAAGDLHGNKIIAEKLAEKARKNKVDLVVLVGDIHGMFDSEDVITPFKKTHQKVVFIPGNWDTTLESNLLSDMHQIKNLDGYYTTYGDVGIVGVGSPDFRFSLDEKKTLNRLRKNFDKMKQTKKILISHLHAAGTKAEFSGFPGDVSLRKAIKYFEPDFFISGHIHEAEGLEEKIGKTRVIQVGRKGTILEI